MICYVKCLCVVSLSQHSNRDDVLYVKCLCVVTLSQPSSRDLLYVKYLCRDVCSRDLDYPLWYVDVPETLAENRKKLPSLAPF